MKNKRGSLISDYLPWILIALAILVISVIAIVVQQSSGESLIDKIKDLFTGRVF